MNNFEEPMEKVPEVIEFDTQVPNQKEDED
jgi:hypothetical protein